MYKTLILRKLSDFLIKRFSDKNAVNTVSAAQADLDRKSVV